MVLRWITMRSGICGLLAPGPRPMFEMNVLTDGSVKVDSPTLRQEAGTEREKCLKEYAEQVKLVPSAEPLRPWEAHLELGDNWDWNL